MQAEKIDLFIADDNKMLINDLREYFSNSEEFTVLGTATDGYDAVNKISTLEPDVVIMDIIMPKLDGLGVLEKIRTLNMPKVPQFIIVSALSQQKAIQLAFDLGADFYIVKPFDINTLVLRIKQLRAANQSELIEGNNFHDKRSPQVNSAEKDLKNEITFILNSVGIPVNVKGYRYLEFAVMMVLKDLTLINSITKILYQDIAKRFDTTPTRVERAMRNAIEIAWERGNLNNIEALFDHKIISGKTRPTNSEFITMVVSKLKRT